MNTCSVSFLNRDEEDIKCGTVLEVLKGYSLSRKILKGDKINRFINIYVNDEDIRFLDNEKTVIKPGDKVVIIPAIAGG